MRTRSAVAMAIVLGLAAPALAATAPVKAAAPVATKPSPARKAAWSRIGNLPDWETGVWQIDWQSLFGPGGRPEPPALTPEWAAKLKAYQEGMKRGENVQNQNANCIPPGMPQIMTMPYPLEFLFSPDRVTIAIETDSQVRRIWTDGRKHPDDPDLTYNGDSIGHWEGQDLVAETIAINPTVTIAGGIGHSDKLKITERFHQTGPDKLAITTTIEDPATLTKPWSVTRPYIRHSDWQIQEYVCEQNNHDSADEKGRAGFRLDNEPAPAPAGN